MGGRVEIGFELKISCFDTMINYHLSQKFKLLGNYEFNHYSNIWELALVAAVWALEYDWTCLGSFGGR